MKRVYIHTLGCRLNQAESDALYQRLAEMGYTIVDKDTLADLCVIHTCAVTHEAEVKCRKIIRRVIQHNPKAEIVVLGCYVEKDAERISTIPGVDIIADNKSKFEWIHWISGEKRSQPLVLCKNEWNPSSLPYYWCDQPKPIPNFHRANIKIQEGCNCSCAYCIIPRLRGPSRSRNFDEIINECIARVQTGTKEIVLTGINIGNYKYENRNLLDLVDAIAHKIGSIARIRLSSIELPSLNDEFLIRMRDTQHPLVPYLHIPLQSGSSAVLKTMNRPYSTEQFREFVFKAVEMVPDIGISTDIMVGFPTETQERFEESSAYVQELPIYFMHVFPFSPREGTPASRLPNKVTPQEIHQRVQIMLQISAQKRKKFHQKFINTTRKVLFEEKNNGYWRGYTDNYIRVLTPSEETLENQLRHVRLTHHTHQHMIGILQV